MWRNAFCRYISVGVGCALLFLATVQIAAAQSSLLEGLGTTNAPPVVRQGQDTQAQGGPTAPSTLGTVSSQSTGSTIPGGIPGTTVSSSLLQPFGANLFKGAGASPSATQTINPNYTIQPGDSVNIQVWGGVTATSTTQVDPEGNVFLQGFGPVRVGGLRAADLQSSVEHTIGSAYTNNVQIYAVLQGVHQINVFVTGFVKFPGRYAGSATDSALDYLVRAGGVDPTRGSYRNIELRREGRGVSKIDLYAFLLTGKTLPIDLREGDTIVVGKQLPMIGVSGSVRNNYLFEVSESPALGAALLDLARPLPAATHAALQGTRDGQPYELYLPLNALATTPLFDQDQLTFVDDAPPKTVSVQIQGSRLGPSVIVADSDIRIADLLNYVAVDPRLANTKAAYLLRQGLAAEQQKSISAAADRLEKALYLAISATTGESQIRSSEAQLVADYINHAREVVPEGRLVVTDDNGRFADIRLQDNDVIVIPEKSEVVMVTGEVVYPQAVVYAPGKKAEDYIAAAGGFTERGIKGNYMIRRANGQILLDPNAVLGPGDELIGLPYVEAKYFQIGHDLIQAASEIAVVSYAAGHF